MKLATWNINSVRLRLDQVLRFLKEQTPDVLCLQETKVVNELFPGQALAQAGYRHQAIHGQKGYHGVAVISRLPFESFTFRNFCGKTDCRHLSVVLGERAGLKQPLTVPNFYVPAGGAGRSPRAGARGRRPVPRARAHRHVRTRHARLPVALRARAAARRSDRSPAQARGRAAGSRAPARRGDVPGRQPSRSAGRRH